MSIQHLSNPYNYEDGPFGKPFHLVCFGLCFAHIVYLAASFVNGSWLIDSSGHGVPNDFVDVWAAGRLVLAGNSAAAYDWTIHKQIENSTIGYDFAGYFPWHYPPPFLAVAALLASFPYAAAFVGWIAATLSAYIFTIRRIVGHRIGYLLAGAFPAVLANASVGQNGFLTATLIGGALGFMERQPVLAGCCLGLLTYKPQFGIVFPIVLLVARRWTTILAAAMTALTMVATSWFAFGFAAWDSFFHWLPVASQAFLSEGQADIAKMQSVFAFVRVVGGGEQLAWWMQSLFASFIIPVLCLLWREKISFELKAAALATGTLLATPYVYLYDLVVLSIPVAFLLRIVLKTGFLRGEKIALAAGAVLLCIFPFVKLPVGLAATLIVAGLIAQRAFRTLSEGRRVLWGATFFNARYRQKWW